MPDFGQRSQRLTPGFSAMAAVRRRGASASRSDLWWESPLITGASGPGACPLLLAGAGGVDGGFGDLVVGIWGVGGDELTLAVLQWAHLVLPEEGIWVAEGQCLS